MSALALLYIVLIPFIKKRYSEKGCYYVWLVIVIGFIFPFRPQWDNAIFHVNVPTHAETLSMQTGNEVMPDTNMPDASLPDDYIVSRPADHVNVLPGDHNVVSHPAWNVSWGQVLFFIWLVGVISFVSYQGIKHYHFIKITKRWSERIRDEKMLSLFQSVTSEMKITKKIGLYLCPCVGSPMLIGLIKPRILLSSTEIEESEFRLILKHELVHYKRKDILYKHLVLVAAAMHWFNPVVYFMVKSINILCEMSCDAEIVRGTDSDHRQAYSETIIGVVRYQSKLKTALSTSFYGGKKGMKSRISSIMDRKSKKLGVAILSAVFLLTIGTGFLIAAANAEELDLLDARTDEYASEYEYQPRESEVSNNDLFIGTWEFLGSYLYDPASSVWIWNDEFAGGYTRYEADGSFVTFHREPTGHHFPESLVPTEAGEFIMITGMWSTSSGSLEMTGRHVVEPDEVHSWTRAYSIEGNEMFLEDSTSRSKYIRVELDAVAQRPVEIDNELVGTWENWWEEAPVDSQTTFNADGTGFVVNFGVRDLDFRWEVAGGILTKVSLPNEFHSDSYHYRIDGDRLILTLLYVGDDGELNELQHNFYYTRIDFGTD